MKRLWSREDSDMGFAVFLKLQEHTYRKRGSTLETIDWFNPSPKQYNATYAALSMRISNRGPTPGRARNVMLSMVEIITLQL
ncbi:MAG TPA: hypothetical protein VLX29_06620 [Nitrospirota bacterium]|nr:hypothetical protein [Nitrospirota bacterium]